MSELFVTKIAEGARDKDETKRVYLHGLCTLGYIWDPQEDLIDYIVQVLPL